MREDFDSFKKEGYGSLQLYISCVFPSILFLTLLAGLGSELVNYHVHP